MLFVPLIPENFVFMIHLKYQVTILNIVSIIKIESNLIFCFLLCKVGA